jgi:3-deoxy-D-manno-octulosonate 8-phosphate phosphatase (KDO 8-P phosphatase)
MKVMTFPVSAALLAKAKKVRLLVTDCDGVLTDNGVYYGAEGEMMKRFSIRDGMGVERLRKFADVETAIMTGEHSAAVAKRAEKLKITRLYPGASDKRTWLKEIAEKEGFTSEEIAFIGDDTNDVEALEWVGCAATPADGMPFAKAEADYICEARGGHGAFREFAELIIYAKNSLNNLENK